MYSKTQIKELEIKLNEIRGNLNQSTGGHSICSVQKHGTPSDYLKHNEGQEFIIRRVLSLATKEVDENEITLFLSENERKFKEFKTSESTTSLAWQSYADGGLEAIFLTRKTLNIS